MNIINIFTSPLEQFQVLPIFSFHFGFLDLSLTNETIILILIGLFSLVMVLTSFTSNEISSNIDNKKSNLEINGAQSAGGNKKLDINGAQSAGGNKKLDFIDVQLSEASQKLDINGAQSAGGNKKLD